MQFEKGVGGALAVAVITGIALWSAPSFTQTNPDPNAAPNPYRLDEGWAKLPAGRKAMFGASEKHVPHHASSSARSAKSSRRCFSRRS